MSRTVYVGNLPFGVTEQDVCNFCTGVFEQSNAWTQVRIVLPQLLCFARDVVACSGARSSTPSKFAFCSWLS